jgi:hypothetical protein
MQRLEVSRAVRPIYGSLDAKGLIVGRAHVSLSVKLSVACIQDVPGWNVNILRGHSVGYSTRKGGAASII